MFICGKSSNKIIHNASCRYVKLIPEKNRKYFSTLKDASEAGYVQCKYCSYIQNYLRKETGDLEKFCRQNGIYFYFGRKDGSLDVISKSGTWKIIVNGKAHQIWLYHKNSIGSKSDGNVPGFHSQRTRSSTLMGYMKYIVEHDEYRDENPLYASQVVNAEKGSKKWKKQQQRKEYIRKKRNIQYVIDLLNNMSCGNISY